MGSDDGDEFDGVVGLTCRLSVVSMSPQSSRLSIDPE
jgi:hypothetical protein